MSDCMIIRRGGGGKGFDPNGAVLKVVTSTGCTVLVTGTGYSKTHQQADGYPRSNNADVTEHFFSIPASVFGTITVTVSKVYTNEGVSDTLTASNTITVNTAGKVYELLIAAPNIILNSTFGLQSSFLTKLDLEDGEYSVRYKKLKRYDDAYGFEGYIHDIPVMPYTVLTVTGTSRSSQYSAWARLIDKDSTYITDYLDFDAIGGNQTISKSISNKYYPFADLEMKNSFIEVTSIVLS